MQIAIGDCKVCGNELLCAPGQRVRFHKECRKEGRKVFGKTQGSIKMQLKHGEVVPLEDGNETTRESTR